MVYLEHFRKDSGDIIVQGVRLFGYILSDSGMQGPKSIWCNGETCPLSFSSKESVSRARLWSGLLRSVMRGPYGIRLHINSPLWK